MSQYSLGTVAVTNGSTAVVGVGTGWSTQLASGQLFALKNEYVWYTIQTVVDDTHLTLATNYVGATASGASYAVQRDFTSNNNYPIPTFGDSGSASLIAKTLLQLDAQIAALSIVTQALNGNITVDGGLTITAISGSLAYSNVAVTGSTIDSTPIGATTPSTGIFSSLKVPGNSGMMLGDTGAYEVWNAYYNAGWYYTNADYAYVWRHNGNTLSFAFAPSGAKDASFSPDTALSISGDTGAVTIPFALNVNGLATFLGGALTNTIVVDTSAVRTKLDDDGAGNLRLRVRSSTAVGGDSAYITALTINDLTGAVSMPATMAITPTLEMYFQTGDADYTAAFTRGHAIFQRLWGTPGKTYVVNGVVLNGKQFDGRGCIIQDAVDAPYCFRLTGFNPMLRDVQFQDQGNCAKVTTNSGGFASGASTIGATSATGTQAGQAVLIQDNGDWEVTQISTLSGTTLTLASATSAAGSSGLAVVASFGLVHLTDSESAVIDTMLVENCRVGLVMSSSSAAGAEVARPIIRDIRTPNARYAAAIKQGNVHDVNFRGLTSFSGPVDTFTYTGGGVAGSFGVGYAVDLTRDLTVTVNGVAQVYGVNFELTDSYTITFLSGHYPAYGSTIVIQNDHAGVRGWVEDQRGAVVAGGNIFRDFRLLGNIIALECQSVGLSNYTQTILDTNMQIGLLLNNCSFDLNFDQLSSTWARQPIVIFNSGSVKFGSLETDQTPSADINPFIALGAYEITADASSYVDIDLALWESSTYLYNPPGNVKLRGGQQRVFSSATTIAAGSTAYLGAAGQQPQYAPIDIADDNDFVVSLYASLTVAPGAGQTVTINLVKNVYGSPPTTVLSYVISGSSYGGFMSFAPQSFSTGDTLGVEAVYSSGAAASIPRGFYVRK